jgi:hypothetical protein
MALATPAPTDQEPVDDDPEPDIETNIFEHNKWLKRLNCQPAQSHRMV